MRKMDGAGLRRLPGVLAAFALCGGAASGQSEGPAGPPASRLSGEFRLLELDGRIVKWGAPSLGEGAVVGYAYVETVVEHSAARNCRAMEPLDSLLARAGIDRGAFEALVASSFENWRAVANVEFRLTDAAGADILIGADAAPTGAAFADVRAGPSEGNVGVINHALICLDPSHEWKADASPASRRQDLSYAVTHEIGHALGLNHPGPKGQLMSFDYDEATDGLRAGDVMGAQLLYGPPRGGPLTAVSADAASAR